MTEETKKTIIEQTLAGLTDEQIAAMIGYSAKAVKYQRTKAGIIKGAHGHIKTLKFAESPKNGQNTMLK